MLVVCLASLGYYLFRPLPHHPIPADLVAYDLSAGTFTKVTTPPEVFGVGLSYAAHIEEAALHFDPALPPPVFRKHVRSFNELGQPVALPGTNDLAEAADEVEAGLGQVLKDRFGTVEPMLDYEGELGIVLLEDIDPAELAAPDYVPKIGFLVTNDLSARSLALMGEGRANRYDYWGASKSFPDFLACGARAWVPDHPRARGIPFVVIETTVNGEVRQSSSTADLIYTPLEMLRFVHAAFPDASFRKGTLVLTGTPGGVAFATPRWLIRTSNLLRWDRFKKLSVKMKGDQSVFLQAGDRVTVKAGKLGEASVVIAADGHDE